MLLTVFLLLQNIGLLLSLEYPLQYKRSLENPGEFNLSDWRVVDDWPEKVPVIPEEVDVIERWFGDIPDELFGPKDPDLS